MSRPEARTPLAYLLVAVFVRSERVFGIVEVNRPQALDAEHAVELLEHVV